MIFLVLGLFALVGALLLASLWTLSTTGVPVHAAKPEAIAAALDLLTLKEGERFADLGCGFGGALHAATRRSQAQCTGLELNPFVCAVTWARCLGRARVRWGDFRKADLSGFHAVYCYLIPRFFERNAAWIETAFAPGTRVVSVDFAIPGWAALEVREVGPLRQPIRLYVVGRHR